MDPAVIANIPPIKVEAGTSCKVSTTTLPISGGRCYTFKVYATVQCPGAVDGDPAGLEQAINAALTSVASSALTAECKRLGLKVTQ